MGPQQAAKSNTTAATSRETLARTAPARSASNCPWGKREGSGRRKGSGPPGKPLGVPAAPPSPGTPPDARCTSPRRVAAHLPGAVRGPRAHGSAAQVAQHGPVADTGGDQRQQVECQQVVEGERALQGAAGKGLAAVGARPRRETV